MFQLFLTVVSKYILMGRDYLGQLTVKAYWRMSRSVSPLVGAARTEARSVAAASDLKNFMTEKVRSQEWDGCRWNECMNMRAAEDGWMMYND